MKKLALMAVVALMAAPVLAQEPPHDATAAVEIEVVEYVAVVIVPGLLDMTVSQTEGDALAAANISEGVHQATTPFQVQGNDSFTVQVIPAWKSNSVIHTPGSEGGIGDQWPTAYTGGTPNTEFTNGIGFGLSIANLTAGTADGWTPAEGDCHLAFNPGVSDGSMKINTYVDSGRSGIPGAAGGELAPIGTYTTVLYLTLIP